MGTITSSAFNIDVTDLYNTTTISSSLNFWAVANCRSSTKAHFHRRKTATGGQNDGNINAQKSYSQCYVGMKVNWGCGKQNKLQR